MAGNQKMLKGTHLYSNHQRGDTIVEVLIAAAIVSLVLVGAYVVTNRNRIAMQDTQEHSIALKLVEGQTELLRGGLATPANGECFGTDGSVNTGGDCIVTAEGVTAPANYGGAAYKIAITSTGVGPAQTFEVTATWDNLTKGTSTVSSYYRRAT